VYACSLSATETPQGSKKASGTSTPRGQYLPSARLTVNAAKGKEKKHKIDLADMIGSSDDIARRIQEQLERPKAMFSEGGPVRRQQRRFPGLLLFFLVLSRAAYRGARGVAACVHLRCEYLGEYVHGREVCHALWNHPGHV
jgi:hypothetical protein